MRLFNIILVVMAIFIPRTMVRGEGTPRILSFEPNVISIDTVRYDAGEITVRFECTNICDKPVAIIDVRSQCGCTRPSFGKASIAPGKKGYVDVVFDPHTLFADQKRHLTVVATNGEYRKFSTLTITGYVDRGVSEEEVRYPYVLAEGLRSDQNTIGMRLSKRGDVPVREFTIYNGSSSVMKLDWTAEDRCVMAEVPDEIKPGESAKIKVSVKTRWLPSGTYQKSMTLMINGNQQSERILLKGSVE
ncbi:MAG: DUF1573 domain-containing protein [Bacteroidales bacterium]|nr:DUF1573 domain-containing protein [Bacteroidales bacterium]